MSKDIEQVEYQPDSTETLDKFAKDYDTQAKSLEDNELLKEIRQIDLQSELNHIKKARYVLELKSRKPGLTNSQFKSWLSSSGIHIRGVDLPFYRWVSSNRIIYRSYMSKELTKNNAEQLRQWWSVLAQEDIINPEGQTLTEIAGDLGDVTKLKGNQLKVAITKCLKDEGTELRPYVQEVLESSEESDVTLGDLMQSLRAYIKKLNKMTSNGVRPGINTTQAKTAEETINQLVKKLNGFKDSIQVMKETDEAPPEGL